MLIWQGLFFKAEGARFKQGAKQQQEEKNGGDGALMSRKKKEELNSYDQTLLKMSEPRKVTIDLHEEEEEKRKHTGNADVHKDMGESTVDLEQVTGSPSTSEELIPYVAELTDMADTN